MSDGVVYAGNRDGNLYAIATSAVKNHDDEFSTPAVDESETGAIEQKESFVPPGADGRRHDIDEPATDLGDGGDTDDEGGRVNDDKTVNHDDDITVVRSVYLPLKMVESLREARERGTASVRACRDRARELHDFVDQYSAATAEQSHADLCDNLHRLVTSLNGVVSSGGVTNIRTDDDLYRRIDSVTYQTERFFLRSQQYDSVE